eukprot:gene5230-8841_t
MTDTKSEKKTKLSPKQIVDHFIRQYYQTLSKEPENLHKFYSDDSHFMHNFPEAVQGIAEIENRISGLELKKSKMRIFAMDWQCSLNDSFLISVQGVQTLNEVQRKFAQTFVLAKQDTAYFVMNDIFRFTDEVQKPENQLNMSTEVISTNTTPVKQTKPIVEKKETAPPVVVPETKENEETKKEKIEKKKVKGSDVKTTKTKTGTEKQQATTETEPQEKQVTKKQEKKDPESFTYASIVGENTKTTTTEQSTLQDSKKKKPKKKVEEVEKKQEKPSVVEKKQENGKSTKKVEKQNQKVEEKKTQVTNSTNPTNPPQKKNHYPNTIYISKVPEDLTEDDLQKHFKKYGKILGVSNKAKEKQFAFVYYETEKEMENAIKDNGKIKIRDTVVSVEKRKERAFKPIFYKKNNKKKNPQEQEKNTLMK